jgi:hypothetical protein
MRFNHRADTLPEALGLTKEEAEELHHILYAIVRKQMAAGTPVSVMVELLYQRLGIAVDPLQFYLGYGAFAAMAVAIDRLTESAGSRFEVK